MSTSQITEDPNMESVVYGHGDTNFTIFTEGFTFSVHREVICQASAVWRAMLTGEFAESCKESVTLHDDDPKSLKMVFDIIYGQLSTGAIDPSNFPLTQTEERHLRTLIDKYELKGVATFVVSVKKYTELANQDIQLQQAAYAAQNYESQLRDLKSQHEGFRRSRLMGSGMLVNYEDRPPVGTRVVGNDRCRGKQGVIISNSEDAGTEIGVRWNDGTESHNLWCGKKGGKELRYL